MTCRMLITTKLRVLCYVHTKAQSYLPLLACKCNRDRLVGPYNAFSHCETTKNSTGVDNRLRSGSARDLAGQRAASEHRIERKSRLRPARRILAVITPIEDGWGGAVTSGNINGSNLAFIPICLPL